MNARVHRVVRALLVAERQVALLERVRPTGYARELERLSVSYERGSEALPRLEYAPSADLTETRRALSALVDHCRQLGEPGRWLGERAEELALEAALAEAVGSPDFGSVASQRYGRPVADRLSLDALLGSWSDESESEPGASLHWSCDRTDASSLYSVLVRRLAALEVRAKVRVERDLIPLAAVGSNAIVVRAGELLSLRTARRIVEHEIVGHLLPRLQACLRRDVLSCGCRHSGDDEEGRALLLEERSQLMGPSRRRELALRHRAAEDARGGAEFVEVVRRLRGMDVPVRTALGIALRAFRGATVPPAGATARSRGGGLGRELVYLPAYLRLAGAFRDEPLLESFFALGRASLEYARAALSSG